VFGYRPDVCRGESKRGRADERARGVTPEHHDVCSDARVVVDQVHQFHGSLRARQIDGGTVTLTPLDRMLRVSAPLRELDGERDFCTNG
jgi:hypothetical protein